MAKQKRAASTQYGRALVQPASLDTEAREVDVVFATETPVPRFGWEEDYDEVLVCEAGAIRMERANRGLPVMDCHNTWSVFAQLGRTVKVWINERRELCARIKFSQRAQVAELFQDITDGIVKDISVGYNVFKFERANRGLPVMDCHNTWSVFAQLGRTVKVWINERRELCARIKFSQRAQVAELFQDITDGIVKDISVGYNVFKFERVEQPDGKNPIYRAIDWMPTELSFAPVQADIKSEIRGGQRTHTVEIISNKQQTTMSKRAKNADKRPNMSLPTRR